MADKDYARKPYITSGGYDKLMSNQTSKSVWNLMLDVYPFLSEFSQEKLGAYDIKVEEYLRQSERKKPYDGRPFEEMEDFFEGYPGIWPDDDSSIDFPWTTPGNLPGPGTVPGINFSVFSVSVQYCYCDGGSNEVTIVGSHNILSVSPDKGTFDNITVNTAKSWTGDITVPAGTLGAVEFTVKMVDPATGLVGNATDSIIKCSESTCCDGVTPVEYDEATSADTINRNNSATIAVEEGKGPYTWDVSGTGLSFPTTETTGTSNTLEADGTACGTGTITVTDACENETTGEIRVVEASAWVQEGSDPNCCAGGNTIYAGGPMPTGPRTESVITGGTRQTETVTGPGVSSGCTSCAAARSSACGAKNCESCLTWGAYRANSSPICFNGFSGVYPQLDNQGGIWYCADSGASQCEGGRSRQCTPVNETVYIGQNYAWTSQICERWECT
jgi:hypothetical protein